MAIILQENLRGLFYAPYYAALARGAYRREGLEVQFAPAQNLGGAATVLFDGAADVAWGGPMRVNQFYQQRPDCDLVCFGEAVTRDPFLLVGRTPNPNFAMTDLMKARVATVSEVPTPWLCLQEDLRRAGLDPAALNRVADRNMAENMAALRAGAVDVVQLFQPFAEELLADGSGHLWYAAADRGPCAYTTFYARRPLLTERRDELRRLVRGLYKTQQWLHQTTPATIAETVRPYFPAAPVALLEAALGRYAALGIWNRTPVLPRDGYERLKASLVSGGFCAGTPFETAVDNSLAEEVVCEGQPAS